MRGLIVRLATILSCIVASAGLAVMTAAPASAEDLEIHMYGSTHPFYDLGFGHYSPGSNGGVYVKDTFCDGDNGIIAALYYWNYSEWKRSDLASVRGCGATNYNDSDAPFNSSIRFRVCKLLPDGTWKDCFDKFTLT